MTRVNVPTLQCDRCKRTTQDLNEMGTYRKIMYYDMTPSNNLTWDLCPSCWCAAVAFLSGSDE